MQKDNITSLIDAAIDDNHHSTLRTVKVVDEEHVEDIYRLIRNYSVRPFSKELLTKLHNKPGSEVCMEILYGTLGEGMEGYYELEAKASVLALRNRKSNSLTVLRFSHDPWFEPEVAVAWANYRINKFVERRKGIQKIHWYVDEKNLSLQIILRKLDYIAQSIDNNPDELVFIKE